MIIDTKNIISITQANQNFSYVTKMVDENGEAVIFKNNHPKYLVLDIDSNEVFIGLSDEEKTDIVAKRILAKYLPAFKELAK